MHLRRPRVVVVDRGSAVLCLVSMDHFHGHEEGTSWHGGSWGCSGGEQKTEETGEERRATGTIPMMLDRIASDSLPGTTVLRDRQQVTLDLTNTSRTSLLPLISQSILHHLSSLPALITWNLFKPSNLERVLLSPFPILAPSCRHWRQLKNRHVMQVGQVRNFMTLFASD